MNQAEAIARVGEALLGPYRCKHGCLLKLRPLPLDEEQVAHFAIRCREHGNIRNVFVSKEVLVLTVPLGPKAVADALAQATVRAVEENLKDAVEWQDIKKASTAGERVM